MEVELKENRFWKLGSCYVRRCQIIKDEILEDTQEKNQASKVIKSQKKAWSLNTHIRLCPRSIRNREELPCREKQGW